MKITEPLRHEHAELLPRLAALDAVAGDMRHWSSDTPRHVNDLVAFLRGHLVPHASAEEAVLYPAVERAMGAPGATDTMKADHVEIVRRIDLLAETIDHIGSRPPSAEETEQLQAQLYGLSAILYLHFHKEEDVLLPVLDARLTDEDAQRLFADMAAVAHAAEDA
jgi:iron-sulfur cluster repair protein YtfE (RIC family)